MTRIDILASTSLEDCGETMVMWEIVESGRDGYQDLGTLSM